MKVAFYCKIGGHGFSFLLPEEADKLRAFFAILHDKPALGKPSSARNNFCRVLDIRVPQIVEAVVLNVGVFADRLKPAV